MAWIWLSKNRYPDKQHTKGTSFDPQPLNYCVASFERNYKFDKEISSLKLKFAADTSGYLTLDEKVVFVDNPKTVGDFCLKSGTIQDIFYFQDEFNLEGKKEFTLKSFVQLGVTRLYDFSSGQGSLFVEGEVTFKDGTKETIETDSSWLSRLETLYPNPYEYDNTVEQEKAYNACITKNKRILKDSTLKNFPETEIEFNNKFNVKANSKKVFKVDLSRCYATHYEIEVIGDSLIEATLTSMELKNVESHTHKFKSNKSCKFRMFDLISCGGFVLDVDNKGNENVEIIVHVLHTHYPFERYNKIETSNVKYNDLFEKCAFAITNCSNSILLDSPKHCEPSGSCSGDYNIISLGNAFLTGDFTLAKHHLREYARLHEISGGVNANSSYALIFVKWLKNIYMMTGDKTLVLDCQNGIKEALDLYTSFIGEDGLIEKSFNYIFLDWLVVDGFTMFAPPKNLGQSAVCMTFYEALNCGSFLYNEVGNTRLANKYSRIAKRLKKAINSQLFDKEKGLYVEGLTTPEEEQPRMIHKPPVTDKVYYRKHANILAVAYGLQNRSTSRKIVSKIFKDPLIKDLPVQPYFDHYLFEAIHKVNYDKKYALKLMNEFTHYIKIKDKGLPEGFFLPHDGYTFDFSHAWACTPYYSFIVATLGLTILEPGYKKISIKPMMGKLNYSYTIPTQFGDIKVSKNNDKFEFVCPKEIEVVR